MKNCKNLIPVVCPQCNAKIELDKSLKKGYCSYCGTEILIKDIAKDNIITFENYIKLADRAYEDKKYEVAHNYYLLALKLNPDDWYIVWREGQTSSFLGNFDNFNLIDAVHAVTNALELLEEDTTIKKEDCIIVKLGIAAEMISLLKRYYDIFMEYNTFSIKMRMNYTIEDYVTRLLHMKYISHFVLEKLLNEKLEKEVELNNSIEEAKKISYENIIELNILICKFAIGADTRKECVQDYDMCVMKLLELSPNKKIKRIRKFCFRRKTSNLTLNGELTKWTLIIGLGPIVFLLILMFIDIYITYKN